MLELRPVSEATVSPGVPKLLQLGHYVKFTSEWPDTLPNVKGKFFQIDKVNQVSYDLYYTLPTNDFRDVDLSNQAGGENLYPENTRTLYEVLLGFKPGNYMVSFQIPAGEQARRLDQAGMIPNVTSATLKYLGASKPEDSPYEDKRIFMYFIKDLEPMILRTFVDTGCDYEKCVFGLTVNKCHLKEKQSPTPEQWAKAKELLYYTELRW